MKAFAICLVLAIASVLPSRSQGFDWQYSPRFPATAPSSFVGVGLGLDFAIDQADLEFVEKATQCQSFKNGSGHFLGFSIRGEHWIGPERALFASVGYLAHAANFTRRETVPLSPTENLESEYEFSPKLNYIAFEVGARERLFGSHFSAGISLALSLLASHDFQFTETIISPDNFPWHERTINSGQISGLNSINLYPKLFASYDLSLMNSMYANISAGISFPVNDIADGKEWKRWSFSLGIAVYRGVSNR